MTAAATTVKATASSSTPTAPTMAAVWSDAPRRLATIAAAVPLVWLVFCHDAGRVAFFHAVHLLCAFEWAHMTTTTPPLAAAAAATAPSPPAPASEQQQPHHEPYQPQQEDPLHQQQQHQQHPQDRERELRQPQKQQRMHTEGGSSADTTTRRRRSQQQQQEFLSPTTAATTKQQPQRQPHHGRYATRLQQLLPPVPHWLFPIVSVALVHALAYLVAVAHTTAAAAATATAPPQFRGNHENNAALRMLPLRMLLHEALRMLPRLLLLPGAGLVVVATAVGTIFTLPVPPPSAPPTVAAGVASPSSSSSAPRSRWWWWWWWQGVVTLTIPFWAWLQLTKSSSPPSAALHGANGGGGGFVPTVSLLLTVWNCDTGALIAGRLFGGRGRDDSARPRPSGLRAALARVSPQKSVEGLLGGLAAGTLTYARLVPLLWRGVRRYHHQIPTGGSYSPGSIRGGAVASLSIHDYDRSSDGDGDELWVVWTVGVVLSLAALLGDLAESALKRHCAVKDTGRLLPGHGGILDRFDSSLVAVVLYLAYLHGPCAPLRGY